jgi:hypothetical protein
VTFLARPARTPLLRERVPASSRLWDRTALGRF